MEASPAPAFAGHGYALLVLAALCVAAWLVSVVRRDVSIVDVLWGPMFLVIALVHLVVAEAATWRSQLVVLLVLLWSLRLAGYLLWRNWSKDEDPRYQSIRAANEPGFWWKSLMIVFGFQALLAWIVSVPFITAMHDAGLPGVTFWLGVLLWLAGFSFESVGDLQLARFKANPDNRGKVLDRGLWRYTRHPNYFGDFCVWWGFYLMALDAGGWWTIVGPMVMTFMLLRVSGVTLLEQHMTGRPEYAAYKERTPAFFPWPPKR